MRNPMWVRVVGVLATLWNLVGVFSYLTHVGLIGDGATPPDAAAMPATVTACFAIGVFAGVAGSVALTMFSTWARPLLWLSLVGTAIDWIWVFGWSNDASVPLGATVLAVAVGLALMAERMARHQPARSGSAP